jgi:hypothetical protein
VAAKRRALALATASIALPIRHPNFADAYSVRGSINVLLIITTRPNTYFSGA